MIKIPHITNDKLAKSIEGILSAKDSAKITKALVESGKVAGCDVVCSLIQSKTGLPKSICKGVCNIILKKRIRSIRRRL